MEVIKWNEIFKMKLSEFYTDDKKSKYFSNPTEETIVQNCHCWTI